MDDLNAAEIIRSLAAGTAPASGGVLVDIAASDGNGSAVSNVLQAPDIVRALFLAADALEARARQQRRQTALPRNAGKTWSQDEDARLLQAYDGGATVEALAAAHERTRAGIEARLVKHGRLEAAQAPAARIR